MSIYSIILSIYFIVTSLYSINGVAKVLHFNCLYRVKMISGRLLNTTLTENVINCSEYVRILQATSDRILFTGWGPVARQTACVPLAEELFHTKYHVLHWMGNCYSSNCMLCCTDWGPRCHTPKSMMCSIGWWPVTHQTACCVPLDDDLSHTKQHVVFHWMMTCHTPNSMLCSIGWWPVARQTACCVPLDDDLLHAKQHVVFHCMRNCHTPNSMLCSTVWGTGTSNSMLCSTVWGTVTCQTACCVPLYEELSHAKQHVVFHCMRNWHVKQHVVFHCMRNCRTSNSMLYYITVTRQTACVTLDGEHLSCPIAAAICWTGTFVLEHCRCGATHLYQHE